MLCSTEMRLSRKCRPMRVSRSVLLQAEGERMASREGSSRPGLMGRV